MRWLLVAAFLCLPSRAFADYKLSASNNALFVTSGKQRARLGEAIAVRRVKIDKQTRTLDAELVELSCDASETRTHRWTFAQLDARLENTAAFALHVKHDYKAAAAGFARAVADDPSWDIAAYNLASAQQLGGDKKAAIETLRPWLDKQPIATYLQISIDPELAPLMPELTAMHAKQAGTAKVSELGELEGLVAYAPERKLIALTRREASWGACVYTTQLEIYEPTGKLLAAAPVIDWKDTTPECNAYIHGVLPTARKAIAARARRLTTMLHDLGFAKATVEKATALKRGDTKDTLQLPAHKLGVVAANGTARVFRGNHELGHAAVLDQLQGAAYVDELKSVVAWSLRPGREGCEGSDPTQVSIIAAPGQP